MSALFFARAFMVFSLFVHHAVIWRSYFAWRSSPYLKEAATKPLNPRRCRRTSGSASPFLSYHAITSKSLATQQNLMTFVQEQAFAQGRDILLAPPHNVHATIENGSTELALKERVYFDGQLWLDWTQ